MADEAQDANNAVGEGQQAEFNRRLRAEVVAWRADDLITGEQAAAILGRYPQDVTVVSNPLNNRVVSALAIMGSVLIGLGIIAFVAANWSSIPAWGRLVMMSVGTPAIYFIGWFLAYRMAYPRIGLAVILLGVIAFGASIHLIAQTYHVPVNHPNLVALWFLGAAPVAYITRSRAVAVFMLALFFVGAGFRAQEWFPDFDEEVLFFMAPAYLVLAAAIFALGSLQHSWRYTRPFSLIFAAVGLLLAIASIYVLSFDEFWHQVARDRADGVALIWPMLEFWLVMGVAAVVAVGSILTRILGSPASIRDEAIWWEGALVGGSGLVVAVALVSIVIGLSWMWWVFNLVMLAAVVALIAAGYRMMRAELINFAVAVFAITVFTRYFEFGFSLLGQSLAFIVTGLLLLAVGFGLELLRRRMVARMRLQGIAL